MNLRQLQQDYCKLCPQEDIFLRNLPRENLKQFSSNRQKTNQHHMDMIGMYRRFSSTRISLYWFNDLIIIINKLELLGRIVISYAHTSHNQIIRNSYRRLIFMIWDKLTRYLQLVTNVKPHTLKRFLRKNRLLTDKQVDTYK